MGADAEVQQAVQRIKDNLSFDVDAPFQLFETNIRMVGGLAAACHCTGEHVNLATGAVSRPETNIVEDGTYIAEFGVISEWTVYDKRTELGLLPHDIHAETGEWRNRQATIGPPGDSYYESCRTGMRCSASRACLPRFTPACSASPAGSRRAAPTTTRSTQCRTGSG
ncbi:glycoside hydrolase family 47 protein [Saccharopolyspora pogona]|uniref:glycoside hydrolase family 47 protein n=1 Tax=Saccharopolyspora pogona TaxID=333966 RepID=UPI0021DFAA79|nr:glycoside hydrolase family 47 protein [Saccharopolyspora pogona]